MHAFRSYIFAARIACDSGPTCLSYRKKLIDREGTIRSRLFSVRRRQRNYWCLSLWHCLCVFNAHTMIVHMSYDVLASRSCVSARTRAWSWSRRSEETCWNTSSVVDRCRRTRRALSSTALCSLSSIYTATTSLTEISSVRTFCSTITVKLNSPTSALHALSSTRYKYNLYLFRFFSAFSAKHVTISRTRLSPRLYRASTSTLL